LKPLETLHKAKLKLASSAATFRGLPVEAARALLAGELSFTIEHCRDSIDDVVIHFETGAAA